eukprot:2349563-Lingulodinium_polyedra.AAC.2
MPRKTASPLSTVSRAKEYSSVLVVKVAGVVVTGMRSNDCEGLAQSVFASSWAGSPGFLNWWTAKPTSKTPRCRSESARPRSCTPGRE